MTDTDTDRMGFEQEERLPWLEPVDDVEEPGVSTSRLVALVLGGLVIIGLIVGGLWWWQQNGGRPRGELIAAPQGPYKLPVVQEGGRFDGEGDVAVAASEGETPTGRVDPTRLPETPVTAPPPAPKAAASATPRPAPAAAAAAGAAPAATPAPAPAATPAPATGGTVIQLGAFSSEGAATRVWDGLAGRFAWLADVNRTVSPATINGRTVYRLRVNAGSAANARTLCGRFRTAGENCIILP